MRIDRLLLRRLRAAVGSGGVVVAVLVLAAPAGAQAQGPDPSPGAAAPDPFVTPAAPVREPQLPEVVAPVASTHAAAPVRTVQRAVPPVRTVRRAVPPRHHLRAPARKPHRAARAVHATLPARLLRPPAEWIVTAGVPLVTAASNVERVPRSAALALAAVVLLSAALVLHVARKTAR